MCGIVGLYAKQTAIADRLGGLLANMLIQMGDRGPDSAGIALYRDGEGSGKLSVRVADQAQRDELQSAAEAALGCSSETLGAHLLLSGDLGSTAVQWIHDTCPEADGDRKFSINPFSLTLVRIIATPL